MNGINGLSNSLPNLDGKNWIYWHKQMQTLFGFYETLEMFTNGVLDLPLNAIEAQRKTHNDSKKKDCKDAFCIQFAVDSVSFNRISHVEYVKEEWDIIVK